VSVTNSNAGNGIKISSTSTVTIRDSNGGGRLNVTNRATGASTGCGTAIEVSEGTLIIESGTVTATGGVYGAGIGGGRGNSGGVIIINGGIVNATGGGEVANTSSGAGIGGGHSGAGGKITINGGTVTATAGLNAAGIGGGTSSAGGVVTINGGTVNATGRTHGGAGIGGGYNGAGGEISINRGIVNATGGAGGGAGIGGGFQGAGGNIIVRGGTITAKASSTGSSVAIGHGTNGDTGTFGIEGKYEHWMNTANTEPTDTSGKTETFPEGYLFPYNHSYKYMKLMSLHHGDDETLVYYGDVQAKIIDKGKPLINVSIEWGEMKFVFDTDEHKWDPTTHTYIEGSGEASWLVNNAGVDGETATEWYLEHGNNRVAVINHSNVAVDVDFDYAMLTGAEVDPVFANNATSFNTDRTAKDAVVGGFYASEGDARGGALILTNTIEDTSIKSDCKISLYTAVGRSLENKDIAGSVYFAFSGTPDAGRSAVLPNFKKVGTITVTISKNDDIILNTPGDD